MAGFPERQDGILCLTAGGQKTEIMCRRWHDMSEFAVNPLLDDAAAMADRTTMPACWKWRRRTAGTR